MEIYFVSFLNVRKKKRFELIASYQDVYEALDFAVEKSRKCEEPHIMRILDGNGKVVLKIIKDR